ncbi:MAG: hypothetical protein PWP74_1229 [Shewanella sp.]|jgi:uncharacterized membrane protein|nr:hypothetical protein [Shewanella sp.]
MDQRMRRKSLLYHWYQQGALTEETMPQALAMTKAQPQQWQSFISQLLLGGVVLCLGSALICFIAYNWQHFGRLGKLALLESIWLLLMVAPLLLQQYSARFAICNIALPWICLLTAIVTGGVLAYVGQAYQQGADDWQLFAFWSLLALPWLWLGRRDWHWGLLAVLLNLTLSLWFQIHGWPAFQRWFPGEQSTCLLWWQVLLNLALHLTLFRLNRLSIAQWPTAKVAEALCGAALWLLMLVAIANAIFSGDLLFDGGASPTFWSWSQACWWLISAMMLMIYWRAHCLYGLALLMFAQLFYLHMWLLRVLGEYHLESSGYLLMSASAVGLSVTISLWLMKLQRQFGETP